MQKFPIDNYWMCTVYLWPMGTIKDHKDNFIDFKDSMQLKHIILCSVTVFDTKELASYNITAIIHMVVSAPTVVLYKTTITQCGMQLCFSFGSI